MSKKKETSTKTIAEYEIEAIYDEPSVFVDRFYLANGPTLARLTCGEVVQGMTREYRIRASVTMTISDLRALSTLINNTIAAIDAQNVPKDNVVPLSPN